MCNLVSCMKVDDLKFHACVCVCVCEASADSSGNLRCHLQQRAISNFLFCCSKLNSLPFKLFKTAHEENTFLSQNSKHF